jgi:hypothetical protein
MEDGGEGERGAALGFRLSREPGWVCWRTGLGVLNYKKKESRNFELKVQDG